MLTMQCISEVVETTSKQAVDCFPKSLLFQVYNIEMLSRNLIRNRIYGIVVNVRVWKNYFIWKKLSTGLEEYVIYLYKSTLSSNGLNAIGIMYTVEKVFR